MSTFVRSLPGTRDPNTRAFSAPTVTTIDGEAIEVRGRADEYEAAGLTLSQGTTLFFTPSSYGLQAHTPDFVLPGDTIDWNGVTFTAKGINTIAPDGIVVAGRIVVVK